MDIGEMTLTTLKDVLVPDLGGVSQATLIEILVKPGDQVTSNDSLITLESDKASMEIPSPYNGTIKALKVKMGDKLSQGNIIAQIEVEEASEKTEAPEKEKKTSAATEKPTPPSAVAPTPTQTLASEPPRNALVSSQEEMHAGPAVRRLARELGVDLNEIIGSGPKTRILKEDVEAYVKAAIAKAKGISSVGGISDMAPPISLDFNQFGETSILPLTKIKKLTGAHLHRNWISVPHVTQFAEADISDLEEFRKGILENNKDQELKLSPLIFAIKAAIASLQEFPQFNASLDASGDNLILKKYFHIGVAVETPNGLVVPVIRNADQKGLLALAKEIAEISNKARTKGLSPAEMQGGCFTISSLGGIGGTAFTPIINAPEVAILGLSQTSIKPVYKHGEWVPRLMLPLSLSYDHRVIDGAEGARFLMHLASRLTNIRTMLL